MNIASLHSELPYVKSVSSLAWHILVTESDADTLNEAALILEPHIPMLVDRVYAHLFKFSVTKEVFMPRAGGHEGPMVADLSHLTLEDEQIKERKRFFSLYIRKLITSDYNDFKTWEYYGESGASWCKAVGADSRVQTKSARCILGPLA